VKAVEIVKMVEDEIEELDRDISIQRVKMTYLQKLIERLKKGKEVESNDNSRIH